jgi:ribonuclease BN (tRNA processing enzyme)
VICDTMYSLADSVSMKEDWGHSSNIVAIDLCHEAGAKRLALFHHEPTYNDEDIQRMHQESIRYEALTREGSELEVLCAYDGLEIRL